MIQQINLYQIEEPPEPTVLTFMNIMQIVVIFVMLLILISGYKFISYYNAKIVLTNLENKQRSLAAELEEHKKQAPGEEEKTELLQQIASLESNANHMKKMQVILNKLQYEDANGFSSYFAALSKYNVNDLWLTSLNISSSGNIIYLEGETTEAENVPRLLQKLGADPIFVGKTFEAFKFFNESKEKIIKFTIGSNK